MTWCFFVYGSWKVVGKLRRGASKSKLNVRELREKKNWLAD